MNNTPFGAELAEKAARPPIKKQMRRLSTRDAILIFAAAAIIAFFTAIIQTCFFFNFRPFGLAPDLCLALTVACGVKFGPKFGGIIGLMSGFFLISFSAPGISLAVLFYTLVGIAMGILASPESSSRLAPFPLFLAGVVCGAAIIGLSDLVRICVVHSAAPIASYIFRTVLPEILCTLLFSTVTYLLTAIASRHLRKRQGLSVR